MTEDRWRKFVEEMRCLDPRDLADAARWWAAEEAKRSDLMPTNEGEWCATMEAAFEAGRRYGVIETAQGLDDFEGTKQEFRKLVRRYATTGTVLISRN